MQLNRADARSEIQGKLRELIDAKVSRRRLAVASEHGYFVFSYEPDELGLRFELSAGRQVDRERMSVDYAGRCEHLGLRRSRASDNFFSRVTTDSVLHGQLVDDALDTLETHFDASTYDVSLCLEDHPSVDPEDIHKAMENLARERTWAARTGLYMLLVRRSFFVAVARYEESAETSIVPATIDTMAERPVYGIFTSIDALEKYEPKGLKAILLDGMTLFPQLLSSAPSAVRINPGSAPRGELYSNELQIIVDGIGRLRH